jgi:ABC-2 type transport system permease protein
MKKFLKYEMDRYLQGRTFENKKEMPLMLVENQQYIHYNKGSVVMYALKDYIGEDVLNAAIREYLNKVKFQQPPYTVATEFVETIFRATPDSLKYLVTDMFGKITLYENYVKKLDFKKISDTNYKVNFTVGCAKFYADDKGKLSKASIADYVDIGIFTINKVNNKDVEKPLLFTRVKMEKQEQSFEFTVNQKPDLVGIDPYLKLVDRTPDNNTCKFGKTPAKPNLDLKETKMGVIIGGDDE